MNSNPAFSHLPPDISLTNPTERLKNWEGSVYYWWYEYLKCNEEYKNYCIKKNDPSTKLKTKNFDELYDMFGDVHTGDFRDWWECAERGKELFSEGGWRNQDQLTIIRHYSDIETWEDNYEGDDWVFLRVPLKTQSKRSLKKSFSEILDQLHRGKRGERTLNDSGALYKVLGRPKVASLKLHMQIYKYRIDNPKIPDYEIFDILGLSCKPTYEKYSQSESTPTSIPVKSITISRHLRKAKLLIKNTGIGRFPDYKANVKL